MTQAILTAMLRWHAAPNPLSRVAFELSPERGRRARLAWCASVGAALLVGAGASHLYWSRTLAPLEHQVEGLKQAQQYAQEVEQSRLLLRVAQARGAELEHEIDALNKSNRDCQEELTFFRKSRNDKPMATRKGTGE